MLPLLIISILSYLIGSIPFGYILVRVFHGQDVRESGSGNIGATNVARSSPVLGILTLLLDAGKGSAAVAIAMLISKSMAGPAQESEIAIRAAVAGFLAIVGHMFPVWLKFKGGKGVATGLGSFALIAPKSTLILVGAFVALLMLFRFVSLGSILTVALFPLMIWLLHEYHGQPLILVFVTASSLLIVLKHHQNISRLLHRSEPRFQLRRG